MTDWIQAKVGEIRGADGTLDYGHSSCAHIFVEVLTGEHEGRKASVIIPHDLACQKTRKILLGMAVDLDEGDAWEQLQDLKDKMVLVQLKRKGDFLNIVAAKPATMENVVEYAKNA